MKRRTIPFILMGVLLPLPLALLLSLGLHGQWHRSETDSSRPHGMSLVPMLASGERQSLLTYKQECHTDSDCDSPLRCHFNMLSGLSQCIDSQCMTDQHCPEGFACRTFATNSHKDLIRICAVVGVRKEGEGCVVLPREREEGCERGLLCRGHGLCGRPCRQDDPATCPEGYFCADDPSGAACQPTCEGRTCPEGQRCVSRSGSVSVCATVHGQDCQLNGCPQREQVCSVHEYPEHPNAVWMDCLQPCGTPADGPCPNDTTCLLYRCRESCTPENPTACGAGFRCGHRPGEPWTCIPDTSAHEG